MLCLRRNFDIIKIPTESLRETYLRFAQASFCLFNIFAEFK